MPCWYWFIDRLSNPKCFIAKAKKRTETVLKNLLLVKIGQKCAVGCRECGLGKSLFSHLENKDL